MTLTMTDLFAGAGVRMAGNAVTPPAARDILDAVADSLVGAA